MKLVLFGIVAVAVVWVLIVALNPWALHIGGRSTPLLYWHGTGTVRVEGRQDVSAVCVVLAGKADAARRRPSRGQDLERGSQGHRLAMPRAGVGRADGPERHDVRRIPDQRPDSLLRLPAFWSGESRSQINYQNRGFFDVAGTWHGPDLVMDRPDEQGIKLNTGPFIDHATVTLHWASYDEFESTCRKGSPAAR